MKAQLKRNLTLVSDTHSGKKTREGKGIRVEYKTELLLTDMKQVRLITRVTENSSDYLSSPNLLPVEETEIHLALFLSQGKG